MKFELRTTVSRAPWRRHFWFGCMLAVFAAGLSTACGSDTGASRVATAPTTGKRQATPEVVTKDARAICKSFEVNVKTEFPITGLGVSSTTAGELAKFLDKQHASVAPWSELPPDDFVALCVYLGPPPESTLSETPKGSPQYAIDGVGHHSIVPTPDAPAPLPAG